MKAENTLLILYYTILIQRMLFIILPDEQTCDKGD